MKRLVLFLATNIAVLLVLGIVTNILCAVAGTSVAELIGHQYADLAIFAFVYGVIGAFISHLLSKPIAKFSSQLSRTLPAAPTSRRPKWQSTTGAQTPSPLVHSAIVLWWPSPTASWHR